MKAEISENFKNHISFSNSNYHSISMYLKYEGIILKRIFQLLNTLKYKITAFGYPFSYLQLKIKLSEFRYINLELTAFEYDDTIEFNYTFWNDKPIAKKRGKV